MQVENVFDGRTGSEGELALLLLLGDLLDNSDDGGCINVTETKYAFSVQNSWTHGIANVLLADGQVRGDGIWWVDGLVRLGGIPTSVLQDDPGSTRVLWDAYEQTLPLRYNGATNHPRSR